MRWSCILMFIVSVTATLQAHHPNKECQDVHPRIDLIGPLGNRLPMSYRRKYNRPTYLGGKIAYTIAPSSQEAMAWHEAAHQCAYSKHRPRLEKHFFYPKPWEALQTGPRKPRSGDASTGYEASSFEAAPYEAAGRDAVEMEDVVVEPLAPATE